jgi:hypothetical protein
MLAWGGPVQDALPSSAEGLNTEIAVAFINR